MSSACMTMTDAEFAQLRDLIYARSGIWFQDVKKYVLESRLSRRLEELEFDNFEQYLMFLTIGPFKDDEFQEMFNRITINETSFFRNQPQLEVFENIVLPGLLEARSSTKRLRIWSSACSTGQEPYTLAILLHRTLGVRAMDWQVEILATDISEKALAEAQVGRYPASTLTHVPPLVARRYFHPDGPYVHIDPEAAQMVHFELMNLKDQSSSRRFGLFDVIFCRNVMIYFDDAMKQACAQMFHRQLADDGTLFIGHSETLRNVSTQFVPMMQPQSFAYRKQPDTQGARHAI